MSANCRTLLCVPLPISSPRHRSLFGEISAGAQGPGEDCSGRLCVQLALERPRQHYIYTTITQPRLGIFQWRVGSASQVTTHEIDRTPARRHKHRYERRLSNRCSGAMCISNPTGPMECGYASRRRIQEPGYTTNSNDYHSTDMQGSRFCQHAGRSARMVGLMIAVTCRLHFVITCEE